MHAKHLVTIEVCLLNASVLKRDLAMEYGGDSKDDRALNLRLDRIGIDHGAAVDSTDNAPDTNFAVRRHFDFSNQRQIGRKHELHGDATANSLWQGLPPAGLLCGKLENSFCARRFVEKNPVRAVEALDRALDQAKRMNRLMTELLQETRVAMGALSLSVVTFDLGIAVATTISEHEHEDVPRITFAPPPENVRVRGDPDRIAQILGNLLDNAIKYSAPRTPIDVSLGVVEGETIIRVRDYGLGVPADESGRLFTPFFRTSRTQDLPGSGLGLHISRRLAEQHGGRLWLETSTGAGSVFALALPVALQS